MDSAFTRMFRIHELVCLVASHLIKKDISHLMRTSRQMHTAMGASFYRELKTHYKPKGINLWESPEGLEAFVRNIHFVKNWQSDPLFFIYYYHALVAFDTINNIPASTLAQSAPPSAYTSSTVPPLFSEMPHDGSRLIPLPPMTELTTVRLDLAHKDNNAEYFLSSYSDPSATTIRLCGILEHLPQLRELDLLDLTIRDSRSAHLFMTTLQKMPGLTKLAIALSADTTFPGIVKSIFSSVQPSISSLSIAQTESNADDSPISSDTALALPGRITTPLTNLRYLRLANWTECTTKDEFLSIFVRCPNLEKLVMVEALVPAAVQGADISRICPNFRDISYYCGKQEDQGTWLLELMATLPQHQLTRVLIQEPRKRRLDDLVASKSFLRHSQSLREFKIYRSISSAAVALVLRTCNVLESVGVYGASLDLQDAVAAPWASSKINQMSLELNIAPPSWPHRTRYTPYYLQTPPVPPTAEETQLFVQLESFYRQISCLKEMQHLYLGTSQYDEQGFMLRLYSVKALPGMLALSDNKMGRPGFLEYFGGWTKLETIGGNIFPETMDGDMPAGAPEMEWVMSRWTSFLYTKKPSS
ncbi:hypothetical protein BGW39_000913 [Mortierella sp. 14UC]|nr:hypothetical protein BGW39_000913 [Mortierella sp. 14UC]